MTDGDTPYSVRDGDGSLWIRQTDGTYRLRNGNGWSRQYQGYSLRMIAAQFDGIISKNYDPEKA